MSKLRCVRCGYSGNESLHCVPGTRMACNYLAVSEKPALPDTIQVSRAEYEAQRRDAERWKAFNQRMAKRLSPANTAWKLVEVCPMYGEEKEIRDWKEQIDAAINMPANGEGRE